MKSSHSGTPILSPAEVVLVVVAGVLVVVAGVLAVVEPEPEPEFEFAVVELVLLCVSVVQPIKMAAERTQKIKRDFFSIWFAPLKRGREAPELDQIKV
jgi:hypothetical protein